MLTETLLGALGALVVLAFVFGSLLALVPLLSAWRVDPDHLPDRAGHDHIHERQLPHPVPDRADRPRRGRRLLAADGDAVAGGTCSGRGQRQRGDRGHVHRGTGDRVQRCHRRRRPGRAHRAPRPVPAQPRVWRNPHTAGLRRRLADAAARRARHHRPARRLAQDSPRGADQPALGEMGTLRDPAPCHGRAGGAGRPRCARPGCRGHARRRPRRSLAGQDRAGVAGTGDTAAGRRSQRRPHTHRGTHPRRPAAGRVGSPAGQPARCLRRDRPGRPGVAAVSDRAGRRVSGAGNKHDSGPAGDRWAAAHAGRHEHPLGCRRPGRGNT